MEMMNGKRRKVLFNSWHIWEWRGMTADSEAKETGGLEWQKGEIF